LYSSKSTLPVSGAQDNSDFERIEQVEQGGHVWTLRFTSRPHFIPLHDSIQSYIVAVGGLTVDILLFYIIGSIGSLHKRADSMAQEMTKKLNEQVELANLSAEINLALCQQGDMRHILQSCAEILTRDLNTAFTRIWILNEAEQMLELQASAGMYTHINGAHGRVPVGQFKIGRIAERCQPHLTNAVMDDPYIGDPAWAKREGMVAFAGYPLMLGERLMGVVALFARQTDDPIAMYMMDVFTVPASLAGLPGISIPAGLSGEGLPLGLQLLGKAFDEETVFRVAGVLEEAAGFAAEPAFRAA
jgi:hypothetical protein